jgi:glycosyltransferase involved in cell wall biosynthesis
VNIAVDARWIFPAISGIGSYTREIVRHLARLDRDNAYTLLFDDERRAQDIVREIGLTDAPNVSPVVVPASVFSPLSQLLLPPLFARRRIEVYHSPNYMIPFLAFPRRRPGRTRCVVTLHDVIPLKFPEHAPKARKSRLFPLYRRLMIETGARADAIIAVSATSRDDIIEHLHIPAAEADKVHVVHNGVSSRFRPAAASPAGPPAFSAARPARLLYVGRADPYKNLVGLVRALALLRPMYPFPVELTAVGPRDDRYPEAPLLAQELGVADMIRWSGYLDDDRLLAAYRAADLLVQPSRYEGFGLPVIEAMACGVPVVCSRAGSLPEVAGDAAVLVDPDDPAALARAIRDVLTDRALALDLAARGIRRAADFTWERAAAETLLAYKAAAQRGKASS